MSAYLRTTVLMLSVLAILVGTLRAQDTTTQAATGVTDIAATLRGSVTPGSGAFSAYSWCWFDYGTTSHYGSTVNADPLNATGANPVAVSANPPGLLPNTTYHYRVRLGTLLSLHSSGFAGDDMTFTTGPAATLPSFESTTSSIIGDTAANFDVRGAKSGASAATVSVEYGLTAAYGFVLTFPDVMPVNSSQSFQQSRVTGLTPSTTYHWRLKITNAQGSAYSLDQTFTTLATPVVTTGSPSAVTFNGVTFSGTVDPAGHTVGMNFEYGTTTAYGSTASGTPYQISTAGTTAITATATGLLPSTTYHYRLSASDFWNGGDIYSGADQTFVTPSNITALPATNVTDLSATISSRIDTGGSNYLLSIEFGTSTAYGMSAGFVTTQNDTLNPNIKTLSATPPNLLPSTTYHFRLKAKLGANGPVFYGSNQSFTTSPPATPPGLGTLGSNATSSTAVSVGLNVSAGSSVTTLFFDYGLDTTYGSTATCTTTFAVNTTTYVSLPITGLAMGTTYHFRARATNNEGTTTTADSTFTTLPPPSATTTAATFIGATSGTLNGIYNLQGGSFTVTFDYGLTTAYGSTANNGSGGAPVLIIGGGGLIGGGGIIIGGGGPIGVGGATTPQGTSTTITGLAPETTYHYRLRLTDNSGNNYTGADATFTTLAALTPIEEWRQSFFNTTSNSGDAADTATPCGDGMSNLLKYALRLNPTQPGVPPVVSLVPYTDGSTRLSLSFNRALFATDLTYKVEAADDLAGPWATIASASGNGLFAVTPPGDPALLTEARPPFGLIFAHSTSSVVVHDTVPCASAARRFLRLKITR